MLSKKRLVILIALAGVTFGASFAVSMLMSKSGGPATAQGEQVQQGGEENLLAAHLAAIRPGKIGPAERELEELIKEVRHKIALYAQKERQLAEREKRMQMTQDLLKKQAEELDYLRSQLVAPLSDLKEERKKLLLAQIRINREEAANLKKIAARYEKIDSATGAEILMAMCANDQHADAVKILYLMSERAAAKVLVEVTDRKLAAELLTRMKRIEQEG